MKQARSEFEGWGRWLCASAAVALWMCAPVAAQTPPAASPAAKVTVTAFKVSGNTLLPAARIDDALAPFKGERTRGRAEAGRAGRAGAVCARRLWRRGGGAAGADAGRRRGGDHGGRRAHRARHHLGQQAVRSRQHHRQRAGAGRRRDAAAEAHRRADPARQREPGQAGRGAVAAGADGRRDRGQPGRARAAAAALERRRGQHRQRADRPLARQPRLAACQSVRPRPCVVAAVPDVAFQTGQGAGAERRLPRAAVRAPAGARCLRCLLRHRRRQHRHARG